MSQGGGSGKRVRMAGTWRRVTAAGVGVLTAVAVLAGAGTAAASPRAASLAFTPAPYNYGQVPTGKTASRTFTLANTGGTATGKLRVRLTGPTAFTITGDTCRHTLKPGKTCTVTVRFAPTSAASLTATLSAAGKKHGAAATDALTGSGGGLGQSLGGHVYWAVPGAINQANLDGTSPQAAVPGRNSPIGVAVDPSNVYWTDTVDGLGAVYEANLDGTAPHIISTGSYSPGGMAVGAGHIYWADTGVAGAPGAIWEANLNGTDPVAIVPGQESPFGVAVGAGHLYWANNLDGTVNEANLDGTNPQAIVPGQNAPFGVAVGAGHLYWTNAGDGTIGEANLDGTNPQAIVPGQNLLKGVAVAPPPAAVAFTPASHDYGQVESGLPVSQTFTLANTGGTGTGALADTLTGPAAFAITGDTCTGTSLEPGGTCTITVQFAAASNASLTATLSAVGPNPGATATATLSGVAEVHFLYWTNAAVDSVPNDPAGTVNKANLSGSGPHTVVPGQNEPGGAATGGGHLYWAADGAIGEANLDGTGAHVVVPGPNAEEVAVGNSHLYWTNSGTGSDEAGSVWEANLDGTGAHSIVPGQAKLMGGIAVNGSHVYWAASSDFSDGHGAIWEANLDGTGAQAIVPGQDDPAGVALDGSHVYWATPIGDRGSPGVLWTANLDGTSPAQLITDQGNPTGVVVDGTRIYWTDLVDGTVNESNIVGPQPHTLFGGQDDPSSITIGF
jgi:centrosomal CEP192-like protein